MKFRQLGKTWAVSFLGDLSKTILKIYKKKLNFLINHIQAFENQNVLPLAHKLNILFN